MSVVDFRKRLRQFVDVNDDGDEDSDDRKLTARVAEYCEFTDYPDIRIIFLAKKQKSSDRIRKWKLLKFTSFSLEIQLLTSPSLIVTPT
jgi:hypothetical protein